MSARGKPLSHLTALSAIGRFASSALPHEVADRGCALSATAMGRGQG